MGVLRHCWGGIVEVMLVGLRWQAAAAAGRESGSRHAAALLWWRWRNAHTAALLGRDGGRRHTAVFNGQSVGGREG